MANARCVLTDSGGIQEETTILKVPCLTLRENTERPATVQVGSNRLVGTEPDRIITAWHDIAAGRWPAPGTPELWDGSAADRITTVLLDRLG
jgi:UDP-N-acetylglucosamine 2-epimerase (non-hydrolysing)